MGKIDPVKKEMNEPYIFAYFLGANPEYRKQVQKLAESTGLKIVALRHMVNMLKTMRRLEIMRLTMWLRIGS